MNLVIDIGNSRIKYGFFDQEKCICSGTDPVKIHEQIEALKSNGECLDVLVAGSGKITPDIYDLKKHARIWLTADAPLDLPIQIKYETPDTLGFDRIAVSVGANHLFPHEDILIIDAGTAITYDYVNKNNTFVGGNISPGYDIRFKALHDYTHKLPLLQAVTEYDVCGLSTQDAITNGVMLGIFFEVKSYIEEYLRHQNHAKVILTGGNHALLSKRLSHQVYTIDNLGLIGLNVIMEYNKKIK